MKTTLPILSFLLLFTGCWTFNETPYPEVCTTAAPAGVRTVTLTGFETLVTEWATVHGYQTVFVPGHFSHRHFEPNSYATVATVDYVPQTRSSDTYRQRAQDAFEKAGFTLASTNADLIVDARFTGPLLQSGDEWTKFAWNIGTIFFCDYGCMRWTAQLRIRDARTGKLVFHHDYAETYETHVFGLIPLFGPAACEKTETSVMQALCLGALTDRICADATAFLAAH